MSLDWNWILLNLDWILLGLRIITTMVLYLFLGGAFYILWRELKQSAAQTVYQGHALHRLRLVMRTSDLQSPDSQTQGSLTEELSASVALSDRMATTELRVTEEIFPLQPVTLLGRDANNTIVIPDSAASARHARLSRENGVWWLEDLGSKNGTLLNELPLSRPTTVEPGDVIGIGDLRLVLEVALE